MFFFKYDILHVRPHYLLSVAQGYIPSVVHVSKTLISKIAEAFNRSELQQFSKHLQTNIIRKVILFCTPDMSF